MDDKIKKVKLLVFTLKLLGYKQLAVVDLNIRYGKIVDGELSIIKLPLAGLWGFIAT